MSKTHWRRRSVSTAVSHRKNGYWDAPAFDSSEQYTSFKRHDAEQALMTELERVIERGLVGAEGLAYEGTLAGWNTAHAALIAAKLLRTRLTTPDARADADVMIRSLKSAMHKHHRDRYASQLQDMTLLTQPARTNSKHSRPTYAHDMFTHHIQDGKEAIAKREWKRATDLAAKATKCAKQGLPAKWAQHGLHEASELKRVIARNTRK